MKLADTPMNVNADPRSYLPPRRGRLPRRARPPMDWEKANIYDLARRDGWSCAYCGCEIEDKGGWADRDWVERPTVDHRVPRSRGGGDTNFNAVLACMPCNRRKGTKDPSVMFL